MTRESRTPLRKCLLWHFPISPGRTSDIHHGNHRRRRRRSLQPPNPPSAPHPPPPPVLSFLLLRRAARRRGGLRLGRRPPRRRRRRARRRVRSLRVLPEGRHLQPGNGEFLSRSPRALAQLYAYLRKPHMWLFAWGFYRTKRGSS